MTKRFPVLWSLACVCSLGQIACSSSADVAGVGTSEGTTGTTPDQGTAATVGQELVIKTSAFMVPPGGEVYKCQDFASPFGDRAVGVIGTETNLTAGSHHMFAFVMPNDALSLFDQLQDCPGGGTEFHEYLTTAGSPHTVTSYSDGIGRYVAAASGFRMNVHLFNSTTEPVEAFLQMTVHYVDPSELHYKAASIFLNNVALSVPPGASKQAASYVLPTDISLLGAASHMHRLGTHFEATTSDGQMLFQTDEWAEPQPAHFDPPILLTKGTTIDWACDYENDTGKTITFGDSAVKNEMCIFPGEFYNEEGAQLTSQYPFF